MLVVPWFRSPLFQGSSSPLRDQSLQLHRYTHVHLSNNEKITFTWTTCGFHTNWVKKTAFSYSSPVQVWLRMTVGILMTHSLSVRINGKRALVFLESTGWQAHLRSVPCLFSTWRSSASGMGIQFLFPPYHKSLSCRCENSARDYYLCFFLLAVGWRVRRRKAVIFKVLRRSLAQTQCPGWNSKEWQAPAKRLTKLLCGLGHFLQHRQALLPTQTLTRKFTG